jgi:hypothetical protein
VASHQERQKQTGYAWGDPDGFSFVPLAVEPYGRLDQPAMKHLHLLGDEAAGPGGVSRASFMAGTLQELGVGLIRGDSLLYHASVGVLAWSRGTSLWAALIVPADALDV